MLEVRPPDDCGPAGCEIPTLTSERIPTDDDAVSLYELSLREGFGDGLPILPPTEARVRALIAATPYQPDDTVALLPPRNGRATVEKVAVNAAMAGVVPDAFPYVIAALEAMTTREHNLFGLTTTTSSVVSALVVNGPARARLAFDMDAGCMGGAAGRGSATVGRAVQLCLRNIGGQRVGVSSKSVFGQPARVTGLCFAEWEEQTPWATLAEQLGHRRDAEVVTVHGAKGTYPMADVHIDDAAELLRMVAKSVAFPLSNKYLDMAGGNGEMLIAINPVWAARFAAVFPDVRQVQEHLHEHAWQPIELWPDENQRILRDNDRVDARGRVHLSARPDQYPIVVCGGLGSLHTICLPSWGDSNLASQAIVRPAA